MKLKTALSLASFVLCLASTQGQNLELSMMHALNANRNTNLDAPLQFMSESANALSTLIPTAPMILGIVQRSKSNKLKALYIAEAMALNAGFSLALKYSINRQRPFKVDPSLVKLSSGGSPSFPSAHTSNAFAAATSLTLAYPKWYIALPAYSWASIVGYSRIHTGVHYPSDVFIGALLGFSSAYLSQFLNQQLFKTYQKPSAY